MLQAFDFISILLFNSVDAHIFLIYGHLPIQFVDFGVQVIYGLLASNFILSYLSQHVTNFLIELLHFVHFLVKELEILSHCVCSEGSNFRGNSRVSAVSNNELWNF